MTTTLFFATMLFGALGATCRAITMDFIRPRMPLSFPWPTLIVNLLACLLIGYIIGNDVLPHMQSMLCTGFLGGFSTMSTFNHDAMTLLRNRRLYRFGAYMALTYIGCLLLCFVGYHL